MTIIVSLIEDGETFCTFVTTDEGESAPEPSTIFLGCRPGERPAMQRQADRLARILGGSLYLGEPENHSLDFEPSVALEDEMPDGVALWMEMARSIGTRNN